MLASDITAAASQPWKSCSCGRAISRAAWLNLPLVGIQRCDGEPYDLELRKCRCGSTLAIQIPTMRRVLAVAGGG